MNARSNDIRTNSDKSTIYEDRGWKRSDPVPDHIYDIHKSLVKEEVIIRSEIVNCSKHFIKNFEPDIPNPEKPRRIKRCHYVNLCPICNNLLEQYVEKQMYPYRQVLLDNGGKNILMTFKLRHNQKSSLKHLQKVLKDVDLAYQNLESVELGVTTVDHYFDTLGGISRAAKKARGSSEEIPVYIGDQTRGDTKVRTLSDQIALETRSRSLNPKWYEALLSHGHEGVRQIEAQITNTLGWSATTGQVEPWVYGKLSETFVLDENMRNRLAELNPEASLKVANRLLEAHERDYWQPDEDTLEALRQGADELEDRLEGINVAAE